MLFDIVVVGCGFAGSILARKFAEENKKVLVVDRRSHIAGNMYDYVDEQGIRVQKYGPHVFHTNSEEAYNYITQWCNPIPYSTKCEAVIDSISTPSPFNFKTIDQFYDAITADRLKKKLIEYYGGRATVTVVEMLEAMDDEVRGFAEFLFEKDYKLYTAKQWNLSPDEIDPSVLKRVPIVLSYRDTYFDDTYEFIPEQGFASIFEKMLSHKNIEVRLETEARDVITFKDNKIQYENADALIVWTGAIDELFNYCYGKLPYRSLAFEYKHYDVSSIQNVAIVAYPQVEGYTRITEYTKMPMQQRESITVAAVEYPQVYDVEHNEPYYPVLTDESMQLYQKYKEHAAKYRNLVLCGRLADFKYYNMDQVIIRTLDLYEQLAKELS